VWALILTVGCQGSTVLLWRRRQSTVIAMGDVSKGLNLLVYILIYYFIFIPAYK